MTSPFRVELTATGSARAVHVTEANELRAALDMLGLHPPQRTVVVVGGAAGLKDMDRLRPVFAVGIAPVMEKYGAVGVDGGTRSGVMRLFGEARSATQATFPLVGVVAAGSVKLPPEQVSLHAPPGTTFRGLRAAVPKRDQQPVQIGTGQLCAASGPRAVHAGARARMRSR